jgi:hypothetical protein
MSPQEAGRLLAEIAAAYPAMKMPKETALVWRSWLEALPYDLARFAVLTVCAKQDWPKVSDVVAACGIGSEQAMALLVAAKEGGYEIVRADNAIGWTTTRKALPEAEETHGPPIPMPDDVRERIRAAINRIVEKRSVT